MTDLIHDGLVDGRKRRARRRVTVLGGSAALVAIAVGGAILPSTLSPAKHAQAGPAAKPHSSAATQQTQLNGPKPVSAEDMVKALKSVLPAGSFKKTLARGTVDGQFQPMAMGVFDDGHGAALVSAGVDRNGSDNSIGCPDPKYVPGVVCSDQKLADGSRLIVQQGWEYSDHHGAKDWSADLYRADGGHISVNEWNSPQEKDAPTSRTNPPLTPAQLKAAVTGHAFDAALASIPASITGKGIPATSPSVQAIGAEAKSLLPQGITATVAGGSRDTAALTLNDGKGASRLMVSVERWDLSTLAARKMYDSSFAKATTLADGSKLYVQDLTGKGGAGSRVWEVAVSRKDGLRVVVLLSNSADLGSRPTRTTPILSTEQLKAIAADAAWESVK